LIAIPFIRVNAKSYFSKAFEFTRQFFYKWTVNWRFVPEETFLSKQFSLVLLAIHVVLLLLFFKARWIAPSARELQKQNPIATALELILNPPNDAVQSKISRRITPAWIINTILSANVIGMLCARSLHYQFYSWLAWSTPLLLWQAGFHPILQYILWVAQEYAWNVYPSTNLSSGIVVGALFIQVVGSLLSRKSGGEEKISKDQHID